MIQQEAINKWNELNIQRCEMPFSCGGDSMGDWDFNFYDNENNLVVADDLKEFFNEDVFRQVDFYVNSDGHYQGEAGTVEITFDNEEEEFYYVKSSRSEWSECINSVVGIKLTKPMIEFVNNNVANINGSNNDFTINYKRDFILSEADEKLIAELEELISDELEGFEPELDDDGELSEWFSFTTAINNDSFTDSNVTIKGNILQVEISNEYTVYKDED